MSQQRRVILVDIDGCITNLTDAINKRRRNERLDPLPAPQTWAWTEYTPEDREYALKYCYGSPEFYKLCEPIRGVRQVLRAIARALDVDIVYLTGRAYYQKDKASEKEFDPVIAEITQEWLRQWDFPEGELLHSPMADKGAFARERFGNNVAFAIDDGPSAVESYRAAGIRTYVILYPYNARLPWDDLTIHVSGFTAILYNLIAWGEMDISNVSVEAEETAAA